MKSRSAIVEAMSEEQLLSTICRIAGYEAPFTTSWDAILGLCIERNLFKHPRFLARTQAGAWVIRQHQCKDHIARNDSGPIALCQFVAIIVTQPTTQETEYE